MFGFTAKQLERTFYRFVFGLLALGLVLGLALVGCVYYILH
jgi:hypothetical protein